MKKIFMLLYVVSSILNADVAALEILSEKCSKGSSKDCIKLANVYYVNGNKNKALNLLEQECKAHSLEACGKFMSITQDALDALEEKKAQNIVQNESNKDLLVRDEGIELSFLEKIKLWFEKNKIYLIGGGLIFLFVVFKFLTRNKCPKCKSTDFKIIDKIHLDSRVKVSKGESIGGSHTPQKRSYEDRTQVDKFQVTYQCNKCENTWTKKETVKTDLGRVNTGTKFY